jgi:hypothetical protein
LVLLFDQLCASFVIEKKLQLGWGNVSSQTTRFIMEESEQEIQGHWFCSHRAADWASNEEARSPGASSFVEGLALPVRPAERECEEKRERDFRLCEFEI